MRSHSSQFSLLRALRRLGLLAVASAAVLACSDFFSEPDEIARTSLQVLPRYSQIVSGTLAQVFDQVDGVRVLVSENEVDILLDTTVVVTPGSGDIALEIALPATSARTVVVRADLLLGPDPLFSGISAVPVTTGRSTPAEVELFPVPGGLLLDAPSVDLNQVGDTTRLLAYEVFVTGDTIRSLPATWASTDPTVVAVDVGGWMQARGVGTAQILASTDGSVLGPLGDSAVISVANPDPGDVVVCPSPGTVASLADLRALAGARCSEITGPLTVTSPDELDLSFLFRLQTVAGDLAVEDSPLIGAITLPELVTVDGVLNLSRNNGLTGIDLPLLDAAAGGVGTGFGVQVEGNTLLESIDAPVLTSVGGDRFSVAANPQLTQLSFPLLSTFAGTLEILVNPALCADEVAALGRSLGLDPAGIVNQGNREGCLPVSALADRTVAGGIAHTCSIEAGSGDTFCWGANARGELGDGSVVGSTLPVRVNSPERFRQLTAGEAHTCALNAAGTAYCWGLNDQGQLGDGSTVNRPNPTPVNLGLTFARIAAGARHTCGLTADGITYCWGENALGELGDGLSPQDASEPSLVVGGMRYSALEAGNHSCALTPAGEAFCWGPNREGQLGIGSLDSLLVPLNVPSPDSLVSLALGDTHTCALDGGGSATCWGRNAEGQLGTGDNLPQLVPAASAAGQTFASLTAGASHTCGVIPSGAALCWGGNGSGQLGDGTNTDANTPVAAASGETFSTVQVGTAQTCGVRLDGTLLCWGSNTDGQLGVGNTDDSADPVQVVFDNNPPNAVFTESVYAGFALDSVEVQVDATEPDASNALAAVEFDLDNDGTFELSVPASGSAFSATARYFCASLGTFDIAGRAVDELGATGDAAAQVECAPALGPSRLAFTVQPSQIAFGDTIAPAVQVSALNAQGQVVPGFSGPIVVALADNPGNSTLTGTDTVTAVSGVATFVDLSLNRQGSGYTLVATTPTLTPDTSATFDVVVPPGILYLEIPGDDVVGNGFAATLNVTLGTPAGAGGVTVTAISDDPGLLEVGSPNSVLVPQGQTGAQFALNGLGIGTATVRVNAGGFPEATLPVEVTNRIISTPSALNVPFGLTGSLPVQLATPAPTGGLDVTIASDNPGSVAVLTPLLNFPEGSTLQSATVDGVAPGTATLTASAIGWAASQTLATATAALNIVQGSVLMNESFGDTLRIELLSGGQPIAAPAGGAAVSVTADDPTCVAAPGTVTIPQGQNRVSAVINYGGSSVTSCNTFVRAAASGIDADSVRVTVNPAPILNLNGMGAVGSGLMSSRSVSLGASNYGNATIRIESADPSILLVSPNTTTPGTPFIDLTLNSPGTVISYVLHAVEGQTGTVNVTAAAAGFVPDTLPIPVRDNALSLSGLPNSITTFSPIDIFVARIGPLNALGNGLESVQSVRAGGSPVTVTFTSSDPLVGRLLTASDTAGVVTSVIAEGENQTSGSSIVADGGVWLDPVSAGVTTVSASAPGLTPILGSSQAVTVSAPALTLGGAGIVGSGLRSTQSLSLGANDYGTTTVRLTSSDPTRVLVSSDANTEGTAFVDVPLTAPANFISYYLHGVEGQTGVATITATAPGFTDGAQAVEARGVGLELVSLVSTTTTFSTIDPFGARVGALNAAGSGVQQYQVIRPGGVPITASFDNSNPVVARFLTEADTGQAVSVQIPELQSQTPVSFSLAGGGVQFDPLGAGVTTVSVSAPGTLSLPGATQEVTVSAPVLSLGGNAVIGQGLMTPQNISLSATNYGSSIIRVESTDPTVVLVAPDAASPGSAFIDLPITEPSSFLTFYIHGVPGQTGTSTIQASAPGFTGDEVTVETRASAVEVVGLATSTTSLSTSDPFGARVGVLNAAGTGFQFFQSVQGGADPVVVTMNNSDPAVAQLVTQAVTGQTATVEIVAGQSQSPISANLALGSIVLDPLASGVTTVTVSAPGFQTLPTSSQDVSITAPSITVGGVNAVGSGLMTSQSFNLGANDYGATTVRITSSDPSTLLVSPDVNTPGTPFIDIDLTAPQTFGTYVVHGIEGQTGTVTITASAPGFTDDTYATDVRGTVVSLTSVSSSIASGAASDPFGVRVGVVNALGTALQQVQAVRAGAPSLTATLTNSNAAVGQLVTEIATGQSVVLTIPAGSSSTPISADLTLGGVVFDPLSTGTTTVSATIPGFLPINASVVVTVN